MRPRTPAALAFMLLLSSACDAPSDGASADAVPEPPAAAEAAGAAMTAPPEAFSLLGDPLRPLALDSATEAGLLARLDSAEAEHRARPGNSDAIIWLGRRQAYLGRYRDAVATYTEGIRLHRDDPRLYRHRGHRYITLRELDRAVEDLEHAARLVSGSEDEAEPDGQPGRSRVPRSTLHTNIWYHLGLARYLQHDFEGAAHAFRWGLRISPNDDMRVAMSNWLWLSLMRLGEEVAAEAVLEPIRPQMDVVENEPYHRLLLLYKGELERDSLIPAAADSAPAPDPVTVATYGYGVAAWHLVRGDRLRARTHLERVLETGHWPAFGYIAAEAELARLGEAPPRSDTVGSTQDFTRPGAPR